MLLVESMCVFMVGGKTKLCKKKKHSPCHSPIDSMLWFFLPRFLFLPHHLTAVSYHDAFSFFFLFEYLFSFFPPRAKKEDGNQPIHLSSLFYPCRLYRVSVPSFVFFILSGSIKHAIPSEVRTGQDMEKGNGAAR